MQIIFGDHVEKIKDRFTVLELDTFQIFGTDEIIKTWCVVEHVPFTDIPIMTQLQDLHADLMTQYRSKNWSFCIEAIQSLQGRWNGELDSFYQDLLERVNHYLADPPDADWTGCRTRSIVAE